MDNLCAIQTSVPIAANKATYLDLDVWSSRHVPCSHSLVPKLTNHMLHEHCTSCASQFGPWPSPAPRPGSGFRCQRRLFRFGQTFPLFEVARHENRQEEPMPLAVSDRSTVSNMPVSDRHHSYCLIQYGWVFG